MNRDTITDAAKQILSGAVRDGKLQGWQAAVAYLGMGVLTLAEMALKSRTEKGRED